MVNKYRKFGSNLKQLCVCVWGGGGGGGGALPTTYRDYLINSKVQFSFFNNVPIRVSYAWSRKRRRQGQGTRTGADGHYTLCKLFSTTVRFCDNKETAPFCLLVDSNNKLNDPIVGSVFNNIHSRGQILYI